MMLKTDKPNINTKLHMEKSYVGGQWKGGYEDAIKRFKLEVGKLSEARSVLDIGCADGEFLKLYHHKYPLAHLNGCDISEEVIKQAKLNMTDADFRQADIYELPYEGFKFELVTCSEVLEHLEDPWLAIKEMHRVVADGGILVITTPNEGVEEYEEHLWRWNLEGINDLLRGYFSILEEQRSFFNHSIMYIKAAKL